MFHFVVLLLFLPVASQLFLGSFAIAKKISISYSQLTRINSFLAIALVVAGPKLLDVEAKYEHVRRILPHTTFIALVIFLFLLFLSVVASQLVWKKAHDKRLKREKHFGDS